MTALRQLAEPPIDETTDRDVREAINDLEEDTHE